ncbi:MAG: hypothetical protein LBF69_01260 [Prevotellaceae bacterium]|nr:hypothetical protein [Prevotellaceae bacterium]
MIKPINKAGRQTPASMNDTGRPLVRWLKSAFGLKSLLTAVAGGLLLYWTITENKGYWWVYEKLLEGNMVTIWQYRTASLNQRYQMKLGFDYMFCDFIKQHTPDTAVILFPLKKHNTEKADNSQLTDNINSKYWVTHFVYPRRVLYKDEQDTNPRYNDVTHVAIVAGHGYEELDYRVGERTHFTVLPKKQ